MPGEQLRESCNLQCNDRLHRLNEMLPMIDGMICEPKDTGKEVVKATIFSREMSSPKGRSACMRDGSSVTTSLAAESTLGVATKGTYNEDHKRYV